MDSVKKVAQEIYDRIDNDLYHADGDRWWQSDSPLCLIQSSVNPARVSYLKKKLFNELKVNPQGKAALEVGCGGGILCEEIARMGFDVTGIDPSEHSLQIASQSCESERPANRTMKKEQGRLSPIGTTPPTSSSAAMFWSMCAMCRKSFRKYSVSLNLEAYFCYDTLNRTFLSKLVAINISQVWKRWAFAPPNLHVWEMFIKPDELKSLLVQNNLEWKEHVGMELNVSFLKFLQLPPQKSQGSPNLQRSRRKVVCGRKQQHEHHVHGICHQESIIHKATVNALSSCGHQGRSYKMEESILSETVNAKNEVLAIAKNCRHYAMCKVDFLGSGVCVSGLEKQYVSFYPEGRMDLYAAIVENTIAVTEKCVEIADSCNLCGKCDYQCYFVNEIRPSKVMKALKDYIHEYLESGGQIVSTADDEILTEMKRIVGDFWATNDPAVRIAYHHDICPHVTFKMPAYVVMPNSNEEISSIIKLLNHYKIPYIVRGNGASTHGLVFSEGVVMDLNRMKTIDFDEKNWTVKVGPGVAAFSLQTEAKKRGYRVHTAEPSALVCANIMTSGLLSTFSTTYGIAADNYVDAEFIAPRRFILQTE